jgi:hypothetical protein
VTRELPRALHELEQLGVVRQDARAQIPRPRDAEALLQDEVHGEAILAGRLRDELADVLVGDERSERA